MTQAFTFNRRYAIGLALTLLSLLHAPDEVRAQDARQARVVTPFFQQHCVRCHGPQREEGSVRVDQISWDLNDLASVDDLQNILDEITVDSMPPKGEPRPNANSLKQISEVLSKHIAAAKAKHSSGGGKPVRRLTKTEYVNTIYDLLGVRVSAEDLPEDGSNGSFDTEAADLYTTDMHIQRSLAVARVAARRFIASRNSEPGQSKGKAERRVVAKKGTITVKSSDVPPAGYQIVRLICWRKKSKPGGRVFFGPARRPIFEIIGTPDSPQHIDRKFYESTTESWAEDPNVVVDQIQRIQVVNPQPNEFFEEFRKRYGQQLPDEAAKSVISKFVALMNRGRRVDKNLVNDLCDIFRMGRQQGQPVLQAMVEPMALAMCTMEAMFQFETRGAAKQSRYVSPVEMVNRVSYFLWRSAPDAELLRLAQSGKWYDPTIRKQQFRRMVEDEKFERFLGDFTTQWLELDRQDEIAVDPRLFSKFNSGAKASIKQETIQFVSHVIRENLPLRNLIDSDFMLVNNLTAEHYGLPRVSGDEFRVMPVPEGSKRGGILTHAGILMQTGTGDRTSIVERGAFVARKLLNDPPGPPPPLVDELPTSGKAIATMSAAELVAMHRKAPQCASCHDKIDTIGMALEELDAVGLFRTVDKRLNPNFDKLNKKQRRNKNNLTIQVPLQTVGRVNAKRVKGVEELKRALLVKDHKVAEAYVEALLAMANGRKSGIADEKIVREILDRGRASSYPALSILVAVLDSDAFKVH